MATFTLPIDLDGGATLARVERHLRAARRLRIAVPESVEGEQLARLVEWLRRRPGVVELRPSAASRRMLLRYAPAAPLLETLRPSLDRLGTSGGRSASPRRRGRQRAWHSLLVAEVLAALGTRDSGLSTVEAERRLAVHGVNLVEPPVARSSLAILGDQLRSFPIAVLLASSGVSLLLGDLPDAVAILTVIALNAGIGYAIERRNEDLLAAWRRLEAGEAQVERDGAARAVPAAALVPGDVVVYGPGDIVAADCRVLESDGLAVDEATLTGEAEPRGRSPDPVAAGAPLAERISLLHSGTVVVSGRGRAVVVATGDATELATIRRLVESTAPPVPHLERELRHLGAQTTGLALGAAALVTVIGRLRGRPLGGLVRSALALGVAAIPEGLPLIATSSLVRAMQRLRDAGCIVRRAVAVEGLAEVDIVCADKTGTLTENRMRLEVLALPDGRTCDPRRDRVPAVAVDPFRDGEPVARALAAALLNSDVDVQRAGGRSRLLGSSTERALVDAAQAAGLDLQALRRRHPVQARSERSGGVNYVITDHAGSDGGEEISIVKGAPEQVLELCDLDAAERARLASRADELAGSGLRTLALAWRSGPASDGDLFTFLGFAGLRDPLRPFAAEALRQARRAGVRTLILTGDHRRTAESIARELGLEGAVLEGADVERLLADPTGGAALDRVAALGRVTPAEKLAVIQALHRRGLVVAMVGDGINDAPALRVADVGIAVGVRSSDLARQVASVVLTQGDLRAVLDAIGEGRVVQGNLRRAVRFLLATNLSEVALVVASSLLGRGPGLTPMQLLWINLLTDTLPGLALALQPGDGHALDRPPASRSRLLDRATGGQVVRDGLILAGAAGAATLLGGPTLGFTTLVALQLGYSSVCLPGQVAPSPLYAASVGGALALQAAALTAPSLRRLLGIGTLSPLHLGVSLLALGAPWLLAAPDGGGGVITRRGTEERP